MEGRRNLEVKITAIRLDILEFNSQLARKHKNRYTENIDIKMEDEGK